MLPPLVGAAGSGPAGAAGSPLRRATTDSQGANLLAPPPLLAAAPPPPPQPQQPARRGGLFGFMGELKAVVMQHPSALAAATAAAAAAAAAVLTPYGAADPHGGPGYQPPYPQYQQQPYLQYQQQPPPGVHLQPLASPPVPGAMPATGVPAAGTVMGVPVAVPGPALQQYAAPPAMLPALSPSQRREVRQLGSGGSLLEPAPPPLLPPMPGSGAGPLRLSSDVQRTASSAQRGAAPAAGGEAGVGAGAAGAAVDADGYQYHELLLPGRLFFIERKGE